MADLTIPDPLLAGDEIVLPDPPAASILANRKVTSAFIAANPVTITLTPRTWAKKPAGGRVLEEQAPRDPQVMTLVEQTGLAGQPQPTRTVDGVERKVEFMLIGEWDAKMARNDVFSYQGKDWEIIDLYYDNGYETRALVSARG